MAAKGSRAVSLGKLLTRALAIGMVAVIAGAAHSWLHPLDVPPDETAARGETPDEPSGVEPTGTEPEQTEPAEDPPAEQPAERTAPELPENAIGLAEAYEHYMAGTADFIDARDAESFSAGRIMGAQRLSLQMISRNDPAIGTVLTYLEPGRMIIVYCTGADCAESKHVGNMLRRSGYSNIRILADGYPGWARAYPNDVESDAGAGR